MVASTTFSVQCHLCKWILKMDMLKTLIKERRSKQLTASWERSKVYGKTHNFGLFRSVRPQFASSYCSIPLINVPHMVYGRCYRLAASNVFKMLIKNDNSNEKVQYHKTDRIHLGKVFNIATESWATVK